MRTEDAIFVAGHRGLVGSALVRELGRQGFDRILTRTRAELDLTDAQAVDAFFEAHRPQYVFLAAAKVGGIGANNAQPADFIDQNLRIQTNVMASAQRHGVTKLLFLGSSCIYPKHCPQPMREEHLLTGALEPTNEAYAIAKLAGLLACRAYNRQHGTRFIAAMPTSLYGPGDNFDMQSSHVLPAMIRKFHDAKQCGSDTVELWGTGSPKREFLHVDDLAIACVLMMQQFEPAGDDVFLNVGSGHEIAIRELAETVSGAVGFDGAITWDPSKPDGTPRKLLDSARIQDLGWQPRISLTQGVRSTYEHYLSVAS